VGLVGLGLLTVEVSKSQTNHTRQDFSGGVISSPQRPLPESTQHSQETDIHAPSGIRTRNPSKRAAANPHLRPRLPYSDSPPLSTYLHKLRRTKSGVISRFVVSPTRIYLNTAFDIFIEND